MNGLRAVVTGLVKRGLRAYGYEVRPLSPADGRETLAGCLESAVEHGLNPSSVIDVGVAYGTPDLYAAFSDARFLLVEAVQEWEPVLKSLCETMNAEYVVAAASSAPGTLTINVPEVWAWAGVGQRGEPRQVPATTIDNEVASRKLRGPFVIKIDVEGAEPSVLGGATETLRDTDLVILEIGVDSTLPTLVALMRENGFVPHDIFGLSRRCPDNVLVQLDMAFVRDGSSLRTGVYDVSGLTDTMFADQQRILGAAVGEER